MADNPTGKKILIVDDDKFILDLYVIKFSGAGYEVKTADSTDGGIKLIKSGFVPDVIMSDIVMPGMDGFDMVAHIKKEKLAPDAIVVMLTNQGASDDISQAKKLGVDGYIIKATTIPSEVFAEVERIISSKKS